MKTKFVITTVVFAVPALLFGRVIWPDAGGIPVPTSTQFPFFAFLALVESVLFGIGISFIFFGWQVVQKVLPQDRKGTMLVFISIAWLLVSWWPHDNLHRHNGEELNGLLRIEYGFHLTIIIASLIIAYYFWKNLVRSTKDIQSTSA